MKLCEMLVRAIKHSIITAIPCSFSGSYKSGNEQYRSLLSRYYPEDGIIRIGNLRDDRKKYGKDMHIAFGYYKKAAAEEIAKRSLKLQ